MKLNLRRFSRPEANIFACVLVLTLAIFAAVPAAHAGIVSFSGVTPLPGPPAPNVLPGSQPPLPTPIVFNELAGVGGVGIAPAGGIPVDHDGSVAVAAPVETGNVINPLLVSGVIPAGTPFESYLFHFDPLDVAIPGPGNFYPLSSIVFSNKIIGVQLFTTGFTALQKPAATPYVGKLEAGDAAIAFNGGPPLAYYPGGLIFRGLEEDAMAIVSGGFGINLAGEADGVQIDQVRIFVAVPEPTTLTMAFAGILGIMGLGRTRSRAV
jgi:hypothetical protein